MQETWKAVQGYEGLYEVSDLGRVRSLNYLHSGEVKIMKPSKQRKGYLQVNLYKNGIAKKHKVHRLVALAFVEGYDLFKNQVNHINEDKTDNRAVNLEWCDVTYNCNHGTRNKRVAEALTNHPNTSIPVVQLTLDYRFVAKWLSAMEAGRCGFGNGYINSCCKHKHKSAYKYRWLYLKEYEELCYKVVTAQHPFLLALPYRA